MVMSVAQSIDSTAVTAHRLYRHLRREKKAFDS
jgi:hypothetical protein